MKTVEKKFILKLFKDWLGDDLYSDVFADHYFAIYQTVIKAARGAFPDEWTEYQRLYHATSLWPLFAAVADGFADRCLATYRTRDTTELVMLSARTLHSRIAELTAARMGPKVNINRAEAAELATLPGIGPRTAARIITHRSLCGAFDKPEDLAGIKGLSQSDLQLALPYLTFSQQPQPDRLILPELQETEPTLRFPTYVRLLHRTGLTPADDALPPSPLGLSVTLPALATRELSRLARVVERRPFWEADRRVDVPELEWSTEAEIRVQALETAVVLTTGHQDAFKGASLVRNSLYLDFVRHLIQHAQQRLYVQIFFFTSPGANSPGTLLLDDLKAARDRGVDVRLIIDTDLQEDYHQASRINANTVKALQESAVAYRLDTMGVTTHSKQIIADEDQVMVGTHNWTTNSMYRRDETSLYLEGRGLAQNAARRFLAEWEFYNTDAGTRTIPFDLLLFLAPDERARMTRANYHDSRAFLAAHSNPAVIQESAVALNIPEARLTRFCRVLRFMQTLQFPEPTAYALALLPIETPEEFFGLERVDVIQRVRALPRFVGCYRNRAIRYDILEATHA